MDIRDGIDPVSEATGAWSDSGSPSKDLIRDCVHCGFCLTSCPSYSVFEDEMDSPRGRIVLMDVGHEPESEISDEMVRHFDRCLGCMACVTACPSGVKYDRLIEQVRPQIERSGRRSVVERMYRRSIFALVTHPFRLRLAVPVLYLQEKTGLGRWLSHHLPGRHLKAMLNLAPSVRLKDMVHRLPSVTGRGSGTVGLGRVALMQGCVQRVYFSGVNEATVRVLAAQGWEVHAPKSPRCCGAMQLHAGAESEALALAKATIEAYEGYDSIAVNVAGCGSAMKDYGEILASDPQWAERAAAFSGKVKDVHELLAENVIQSTLNPLPVTVAYHDACHLAHGQGIRNAPRELLGAIPGLEVVEPDEWEICCGSAGTYNLTQPEAAEQLGRRKVDNLLATGAQVIAAANPGCALQVGAHMPGDTPMPVFHPITLLDMSIRGESVSFDPPPDRSRRVEP